MVGPLSVSLSQNTEAIAVLCSCHFSCLILSRKQKKVAGPFEHNLTALFEINAVRSENFLDYILQRHLLCRDYAFCAEVHSRFLLSTFVYVCRVSVMQDWFRVFFRRHNGVDSLYFLEGFMYFQSFLSCT